MVFHTASPFITSNIDDPQKELIDPALLGTRNVLDEAHRTDSVARVVLTSSCAAIYMDAADCDDAPGGVLTEDVWNRTASLGYQPYSYSKTVAEKEAWRLAEGTAFRLVTINPCLIMGPAIGGKPTSESFAIMARAGSGEFKSGAPRLGSGFVDIRDFAEAHLAAAYLPQAEGRHSFGYRSLQDTMEDMLRTAEHPKRHACRADGGFLYRLPGSCRQPSHRNAVD